MRGGPEPMMVTSWAQIMSLDPSYIGIYHCIATNSEGSVAAFGFSDSVLLNHKRWSGH